MAYFMYDFWRKNFVKMKKALCNCFKEIFDRLLYYGMNYNPHWNRNFEAASPQASDCTSQFVTWFNLVNILWKGMNYTESALRGAAAKPPRSSMSKIDFWEKNDTFVRYCPSMGTYKEWSVLLPTDTPPEKFFFEIFQGWISVADQLPFVFL